MDLHGALAVLAALDRMQVDYVLVGGLALGVHGLVRATAAIDLFVRPTPENVERLRAALRSVFDDNSIEEIVATDLSGAYAVVRYGPPDADFVVDLIGRIAEAFTFDRRLAWVLSFAARVAPRRPRANGVSKYRSFEEAQAARGAG